MHVIRSSTVITTPSNSVMCQYISTLLLSVSDTASQYIISRQGRRTSFHMEILYCTQQQHNEGTNTERSLSVGETNTHSPVQKFPRLFGVLLHVAGVNAHEVGEVITGAVIVSGSSYGRDNCVYILGRFLQRRHPLIVHLGGLNQ